jgi:ABC-2 type transport system ATP-binding protein
MRVGYVPQRQSHTKSHLFAQAMGFLRDLFIGRKRSPRSEAADTMLGNERSSVLKQVLAKNPDLLLLDEPFAALDADGCAEMRNLIVALARRGKTVILASDSLTPTMDVCDRLAVYYAGKIEALGTLDEILATTDAIRVTGPVLSPETAQRVMAALREGLGRSGSAAEPHSRQQGDSPSAAPAALTEPATAAATVAEVLAPLVGRPGAAANAVREQTASPVNNDRLAALTRPAATAAPPGPEITT